MSATVKLSIAVRRPVRFQWWQAGKVAPIDCSTFTCVVAETTLPWIPAVAPVDLALGKFELAPPTAEQAGQLRPGRTYGLHVVLRNAIGDGVEEFRVTIEAV